MVDIQDDPGPVNRVFVTQYGHGIFITCGVCGQDIVWPSEVEREFQICLDCSHKDAPNN